MFGYHFPNAGAGVLKTLCKNFVSSNYEIAISSDIPSFIEGPGQIKDDTFYNSYDQYIENDDIVNVFLDEKYEYTIWKNGSFDRHLMNLNFTCSFLIWFENAKPIDSKYQFENCNWLKAIFGYDGGAFYEIFSYDEINIPNEFEYKPIIFPGSINSPGGLMLNI